MQQLFPLSNLLIMLFEPHWHNLIKKALGGCCANIPVSTANKASPGSVAPTHRAANHPLSLVSHLAFTLSNLPPFDLTCLESDKLFVIQGLHPSTKLKSREYVFLTRKTISPFTQLKRFPSPYQHQTKAKQYKLLSLLMSA